MSPTIKRTPSDQCLDLRVDSLIKRVVEPDRGIDRGVVVVHDAGGLDDACVTGAGPQLDRRRHRALERSALTAERTATIRTSGRAR